MSDTPALPPAVLAQILTPQTAQPAQPPNAQIVEIPTEYQNLSLTQTLVADVVRQSTDGVLTLRAESGDLTLQTSLSFTPGDTVSVRIENGNPPQNALIRLLSDTPAPPLLQPFVHADLATPLSNFELLDAPRLAVTPLARASIPSLAQPFVTITEATLTVQIPVQPAAFTPPAPQALFHLPQGTEAPDLRGSLPVIETRVPLRTIAAQLPLSQPIIAQSTPSVLPETAPSQILVTQIRGEVAALRQTQEALLSDVRAGEIRAVFIGLTPQQHFPVFQTISEDPAFFALKAPVQSLPIGAEIAVDVLQSRNVLPLAAHVLPLSSSLWASMNDVQEALTQAAPQVAQVFQASVPTVAAPAQMANSVLFFLMAVRSGDVSGWMGDKAVDALKRAGKGDLVNRVSSEFAALSRSEASTGDWRMMALPLAFQGDIHKVHVSYRKDEEHDRGGEKAGTQTRFVMDLSLSVMGNMQLDALFSSRSKRLDLIVRTEGDFSEAARQQMRGLYKSALDETQITGELSFLGQAVDWVRVDERIAPGFAEEI